MAESETQADSTPPVQWEYRTTRIVWISSEWQMFMSNIDELQPRNEWKIIEHVTAMGIQGWELCSILPDADDHEYATMFFKRRT